MCHDDDDEAVSCRSSKPKDLSAFAKQQPDILEEEILPKPDDGQLEVFAANFNKAVGEGNLKPSRRKTVDRLQEQRRAKMVMEDEIRRRLDEELREM